MSDFDVSSATAESANVSGTASLASPPLSPPTLPTEVLEVPVSDIENSLNTTGKNNSQVMRALSVDFFASFVRVKSEAGTYRYISYEDFLPQLESSLKEIKQDTSEMVGYKLPPNVFFFGISSKKIELSIYIPEGIRDITFLDSTKPRVYPNIIVSLTLERTSDKKYKVVKAGYFCTPSPLSTLDRSFVPGVNRSKAIYPLAFSNMYDTGQMCTGYNQLPINFQNSDFRGLNAYIEVIFNSPFNRDLGVRAAKSPYREDPIKWFALLAAKADKKEPFPYDLLQP